MIAQGESLMFTGFRFSRRSGFTLVELLASMTIMIILMGAMTSTILIASHAIPLSEDPAQKKLAAMDVVDQIAGELFYATSITEETEFAVTFTVADRGHGSIGPELIRYEWSGTPGDPLTRQYNGGTVVMLCETVESFSLAYDKGVTELVGPPAVLLLIRNVANLDAEETARRAVFESWGFPVQVISPSELPASFDAALAGSDVLYVPPTVTMIAMAPLPNNVPVGMVVANNLVYGHCGISSNAFSYVGEGIEIADNTHPITLGYPTGALTICSSSQRIAAASMAGMAPGARLLAFETDNEGGDLVSLLTIEIGQPLSTGEAANGRRVSLPSGDTQFIFNSLNAAGLQLERRAIVWAAAPVVYAGVRIRLQPTGSSVSAAETATRILNMPKVNAP